MSTDTKDGYGLNKIKRMQANQKKQQLTNDGYIPEPEFPFVVQPINPDFWIKTLKVDNQHE